MEGTLLKRTFNFKREIVSFFDFLQRLYEITLLSWRVCDRLCSREPFTRTSRFLNNFQNFLQLRSKIYRTDRMD